MRLIAGTTLVVALTAANPETRNTHAERRSVVTSGVYFTF